MNALSQYVTAIYQRTRVHSDSSRTTYEYALLDNGSWAFRNRVQGHGKHNPWSAWHPAVSPPDAERLTEFEQVYP